MILSNIVWPPEVDQTCQKILAILIPFGREYRFNELWELAKENKINVTKPTFIEHLKHLKERHLIIRNEKDKLHVSYRFNHELWKGVEEAITKGVIGKKLLEKKMEKLNKLSIEDQIRYVNNVWTVSCLLEMKDFINAYLDPDKLFQYQTNSITYLQYRMVVISRILNNINEKGEKYVRKIRKSLDKLIDDYFDQELSPTNPDLE